VGHDLGIVVDNENRAVFHFGVTQCEAYAPNVTPALSGEREFPNGFGFATDSLTAVPTRIGQNHEFMPLRAT
jgi:hypothetical protein